MAIPENIDALLIKYDISPVTLAKIAGVSESSVSRWRSGGNIRRENLQRIIDHFGLSSDDILSDKAGLAAKEHGFYMPPKAIVLTAGAMSTVPVVGKIHAGDPQDIEEVDYEANIPQVVHDHHPESYGWIVEGDCMDKIYPEGCLIIVDTALEPKDGDIGVFRIDGYEEVVRRVHRGANTLILSPESYNPKHVDIVITADSGRVVESVGTVVFFQASRELA